MRLTIAVMNVSSAVIVIIAAVMCLTTAVINVSSTVIGIIVAVIC